MRGRSFLVALLAAQERHRRQTGTGQSGEGQPQRREVAGLGSLRHRRILLRDFRSGGILVGDVGAGHIRGGGVLIGNVGVGIFGSVVIVVIVIIIARVRVLTGIRRLLGVLPRQDGRLDGIDRISAFRNELGIAFIGVKVTGGIGIVHLVERFLEGQRMDHEGHTADRPDQNRVAVAVGGDLHLTAGRLNGGFIQRKGRIHRVRQNKLTVADGNGVIDRLAEAFGIVGRCRCTPAVHHR